MRLLVVGGGGFVGTRVVRTALAQGARGLDLTKWQAHCWGGRSHGSGVVEGRRGGRRGAALGPLRLRRGHLVPGRVWFQRVMHQVNGTANAALAEASAKVGVDRFAFISASAIRPVAKAMAAAGYGTTRGS